MPRKKSNLEKILEIDKEISQIKNDSTYMKIRNGLKKLNSPHSGYRFVTIPSPQDVKKEIKIQRRSKKMKSVKMMYKERLYAFEEKINSLLRERNDLEMKIFG